MQLRKGLCMVMRARVSLSVRVLGGKESKLALANFSRKGCARRILDDSEQ